MHYISDAQIQARVTNSKNSEKAYRWVVYVRRGTIDKKGIMQWGGCGGSVITDR